MNAVNGFTATNNTRPPSLPHVIVPMDWGTV